jgi:hypothetical protein
VLILIHTFTRRHTPGIKPTVFDFKSSANVDGVLPSVFAEAGLIDILFNVYFKRELTIE